MKYYSRCIIVVDYQGCYNKKVYVPSLEYFKTNDLEFLKTQNKRKQIKFTEITDKNLISKLRHLKADHVYKDVEQLDQSEINNRKIILKSRFYR